MAFANSLGFEPIDLLSQLTGGLGTEGMTPVPKKKGLGFRNILGIIGDSILQGHGRQPIYGPLHEKKQIQGALQNFLTDPDGAIQALMEVDAPAAISLYQQIHQQKAPPEVVRELEAAGIDPASEEGRAIIKGRLTRQGAESSFARDMQALGIDPNSDEARELYYNSRSPAGFMLHAPDRGSDNVPTVNSQAEYDALPPGARYRDSQGNPGIKRGGATASPSQTFP